MTTPSMHETPASMSAERAFLGSILIDWEAIGKVKDKVKPAHLFFSNHRSIYETMLELTEKNLPIEYAILVERLEAKNLLTTAGGPSFFMDLVADAPTAMYVDHYADIIMKLYEQRQLSSVGAKIVELAHSTDYDPLTTRDQAISLITGAIPHKVDSQWVSMDTAVKQALLQLEPEQRSMPIPTGFRKLDALLGGGLYRGRSYVVAGRPAMGKTAMILQMAIVAAKHGHRVGFFSLEMSAAELAARALSMESGINGLKIASGNIDNDSEEPEWLMQAADTLSRLPIQFNPWYEAEGIFGSCRALAGTSGLDMVCIDYLQLLSSAKDFQRRDLEIGDYTRKGKNLARELNLPLVWGCQISRKNEGRSDKRPELSDLRESGAIEQDQDVVVGLYREEYYNPGQDKGMAEAILLKHRQGPTGTVKLRYEGRTTRFSDGPL